MNRNPSIYHQRNSSFLKYLEWSDEKQIVAEHLKNITQYKRKSLLDVGAGNGLIAEKIADLFEEVTLVEPSASLCAQLDSKFNQPKFRVLNKRFEEVNFETTFDFILMAHVIRYLQDPTSQLKRIGSYLSDNGTFILVMNRPDQNYVNLYNQFRLRILEGGSDNPTAINPIPLIQQAGLKFRKETLPTTLKIPSIEDFLSFLDFIYDTPIERISESVKKDISEYITKQFDNKEITFTFHQDFYICNTQSS